jgi:hypothetical protein
MKIALNSDFRDFYDHWFSLSSEEVDYTLNRTMVDGILKRDQFKLLEQLGFNTPLHGTPDVLEKQLAKEKTNVVLYTDELAHAGEGKYLHLGNKNFSKHKRCTYASVQIKTDEKANKGCQSIRLLFIGYRKFILRYSSDHFWMSNEGKVNIELIDEVRPRNLTDKWAFTKKWPLLAIEHELKKEVEVKELNNGLKGFCVSKIPQLDSKKDIFQFLLDLKDRGYLSAKALGEEK